MERGERLFFFNHGMLMNEYEMMTELESKLQNYKTARKHLVECFPEREF